MGWHSACRELGSDALTVLHSSFGEEWVGRALCLMGLPVPSLQEAGRGSGPHLSPCGDCPRVAVPLLSLLTSCCQGWALLAVQEQDPGRAVRVVFAEQRHPVGGEVPPVSPVLSADGSKALCATVVAGRGRSGGLGVALGCRWIRGWGSPRAWGAQGTPGGMI